MIAVLILVVLFVSAWFLLTRKHEVDKLPGPPALPLLGNTLSFATGREEAYKYMMTLSSTHWPVFRTWMGSTPVIHPLDPNIVETILTSSQHISKSLEYGFISEWLGTGLLTSTGSKWHTRRKMLTPAFHFKILEQFVPVFSDKTAILVDIIKEKVKNKTSPINIVPLVTHCALDIICETAMGTTINAQTSSDSEYVSTIYEITDLIVHRMLRPWLHPGWIHNLSPTGINFKRCLKTLHGFTNKVIKERQTEYRNRRASGKSMDEEEDDIGAKKRTAFLDLLLKVSEESGGLTDDDIREEVDTFMFEGHDTTAMAMSWGLYFLGLNPDIQQQCVEELDEIFGDDDRPPTHSDLAQMKCLERVIKETLRLRPSVFMMGRRVTTDLKFDNFTFPPGTGIYVHIISIHSNPDIFPDPFKFDPDRFLPERALGRHPYAYIPFSAGPRNCIGQKFAMLEQKSLLSTMLRNFKFTAVNAEKCAAYIPDLILRPKYGIDLDISLRN